MLLWLKFDGDEFPPQLKEHGSNPWERERERERERELTTQSKPKSKIY